MIDSRVAPDDMSTVAANDALVSFVRSPPAPADPCLYVGGPTAGDTLNGSNSVMADGGVVVDGGTVDSGVRDGGVPLAPGRTSARCSRTRN